MKTGQDHVPDLQVLLVGKPDLLVDVPLRVNNGGGTARLITHEIRSMRKTIPIKLLQDHRGLFLSRRRAAGWTDPAPRSQ